MKNAKKYIALSLIFLSVLALLPSCSASDGKTYTYTEALLRLPERWDPHIRETDLDLYVAEYCEMGLTDAIPDGTGSYKFVYEMASSIKDITADFDKRDEYGITEDEGRVWRISLNPKAVWQDGTPINADTYIYSMLALLDPEAKENTRARFTSGAASLLGAAEYASGSGDTGSLGLIKSGEYELIYVTEKPIEEFYFLSFCTENWIVHEGLHSADPQGYGKSASSYMSYGPYKLIGADGSSLTFTKNEAFYGYSDLSHRGQFMTTDIVCIRADENSIEAFEAGKIDRLVLDSEGYTRFRRSDYIKKRQTSYTYRYAVCTDGEMLEASGKGILANSDFRRALFLCFDRTALCAEATAGHLPAYGLLNDLYYLDVNGSPRSVYRKSEPAMKALAEFYQIPYGEGKTYITANDAYNAITGYDPAEASLLFKAVYESSVADGTYTEGTRIVINCAVTSEKELTKDDIKEEALINEYIASATEGTGFDGMISVKYVSGIEARIGALAEGSIEMIRTALGGAAMYPEAAIGAYAGSYEGAIGAVPELSYYSPEALDITVKVALDGYAVNEHTYTLSEWASIISGGADIGGRYVSVSDPGEVAAVIAGIEYAVLSELSSIPLYSEQICEMYSKKVENHSDSYSTMYGYGGIRYLKHTHSDREWQTYVEELGGKLDYGK